MPEGQRQDKVAVYMPYSYMLGGLTVFVSREHIVEVDMSVEQCMKLCATAQVGSESILPQGAGKAQGPADRPSPKKARPARKKRQ